MGARVLSVNVGRPQELDLVRNGQPVTSAIWKQPVPGRVAATGVNLEGDDQADRSVHGGYDKAVYSYACEDIEWWAGELDRELGPGVFGENLTLRDADVSGARIGERWSIGTTLLEVSEPRLPCFKLGYRMGDPGFVKRFGNANRPGAYLRIIEAGELGGGDEVEVVARPDHDVTVELVARARLHDHALASEVAAASELSDEWRAWVDEAVERIRD